MSWSAPPKLYPPPLEKCKLPLMPVMCWNAFPPPPNRPITIFGFNLVKDSFAAKTFGDCAGLQPDDYRYDALDELVKDVNWNTKVPVTKIQINTGTGINEVNSLDIV